MSVNETQKLIIKAAVSEMPAEQQEAFEDKCKRITSIVYEGDDDVQAAGILALAYTGLLIEGDS